MILTLRILAALYSIFLNKNGLPAAIDAERLQKELEWLDIISLKA